MAKRADQSRRRRERERAHREAAVRYTLARLEAGGKLAMFWRDGDAYIHIPPEHRHSTAAGVAYLLSCLPEQPPAGVEEGRRGR